MAVAATLSFRKEDIGGLYHHFICSEQATQHMTANANEQDQKAQRALKMALNA